MGSFMRVTVLFFHPFPRRSIVNRALLKAAGEVPGVVTRDLYELYPDFGIDVAAEQEALLGADVVVFQHPLYWYSCPSLMKEWMDVVLEIGWAYGDGGDKLRGKRWIQAITSGGPQEAYARTGYHGFTMPELLRPYERTARLCGMEPLEPFLVQGTHRLTNDQIGVAATRYRALLECLRDGDCPPAYSTLDHSR